VGDRYDIKGSGDISDKADNVVIVWRNEKKEKHTEADEFEDKRPNFDTLLVVDKQRHHGEGVGTFGFYHHAPSMQLCETSYRKPMAFPSELEEYNFVRIHGGAA